MRRLGHVLSSFLLISVGWIALSSAPAHALPTSFERQVVADKPQQPAADGDNPTAVIDAGSTSGVAPLTVKLSGTGSSDPQGGPLTYAWDLDGDGALDDSTSATPSFTYSRRGSYAVRLRVSDSEGDQGYASVTVNVENTPPTATIDTPTASTDWAAGQTINVSASVTDAEDGTIPDSSVRWTVILHYCPSTCLPTGNASWANFTGMTGSFVAPDDGQPTYLELRVSVQDSGGLLGTASVMLQPRRVNLTFASSPQGATLGFDGEQSITPFTRTVIEGSSNTISAPTQTLGGEDHAFLSWSDSGAAEHQISAPATDTTYTATYTPSLVAAYGMDEGSGTAVGDVSGRGNDGTATSTSWSPIGRYGGSLSFDGTSSWVTVPDSASLRPAAGMTLEAWVRPTNVTGWRTVMMKEHASGLAYLLAAGSDTNRPHVSIHTSHPPELDRWGPGDIGAPDQLPLNTWSHLAATYDGLTLRLYVNGTQVAQVIKKTGPIRADDGVLRIGGNSLWGQHFSGRIDEVRVYNRARTPAEIQTDMNTPIGHPAPDTQAPTAPGSLSATGGPGSAQLAWTASSDNVGVKGYMIYRSTTPGFTPSAADQVGSAEGTSFKDSSLEAGTYYYQVRAFDDGDNVSDSSAEDDATAGAPPPVAGLVAAYAMNEGPAIIDSSGYGNPGTADGATYTTSGKYGGALSFGGASSWVTVPDSTSLRLSDGMTVEAWVNPVTVTGWHTVVMKEHASGLAYLLTAGSDTNRPHAAVHTTALGDIGAPDQLPLDTWTHLAATYGDNTLRLYVNGTQVAQVYKTDPIRADDGVLRIGGNSLWGQYFDGLIDEVRVYDRALTASEIQTDMDTAIT